MLCLYLKARPLCISEMPQKVLPVLEIEGKTTIVQSKAISRFVARELSKSE